MAKRFTDTDKYKKPFLRCLDGAYKLLWDYLYHDCDHAGVWIVDFEIAQIYLGQDMKVNREDALKYFNKGKKRVVEFDDGNKWFLPSFVKFQYGDLNPNNKAHNSVINILKKYNLVKKNNHHFKVLTSPLQGAKDKDKDKDKDMDKDMVKDIIDFFNLTCGTNYKYDVKRIVELINGRLSEKYTLDDFKTVIKKQYGAWKDRPDMVEYITPNTLFRPTKFPKYLNKIAGVAKTNDDKEFDQIINGMD